VPPYVIGEIIIYTGNKAESLKTGVQEVTLEEDSDSVVFEIIQGNYGGTYVGTIEDKDYGGWTAVLYLWSASGVMRINGKTATAAYSSPNTTISYVVESGDFVVPPGTYYGMFKLTTGPPNKLEHTLKFTWEVFGRPAW